MKPMEALDRSKTYLVTGAAGFIGFHLSKRLLEHGCRVIGFDNINDYYEVGLKHARLKLLENENFCFIKGDLADRDAIEEVFRQHRPQIVVNLAAQAGVRYSIECPEAYIQSNIIGFFNLLECCRRYLPEHLVYASSSSVYGANQKVPFSVADRTDSPVSLYAATKKSNESMAYAYSHLYGIPATGLRFFTVYGPYGRPDMAYFSFAKAIQDGKQIKIFNHGDMYRDFTYIDDVINAMERLLCAPPLRDEGKARHRVYNVGNHKPERLTDFIAVLERYLGKEAKKEYLPMQDGDVYQTYADITGLYSDFGFQPATDILEGLKKFTDWFIHYYGGRVR